MSMRVVRGVTALAMVSASLVGCAKGGADAKADSAAPKAAGATGGKIVIAVIGKSSDNPVFLAARTGAEVTAKQISDSTKVPVEIAWLTPAKEDAEVQAQRVRQAVNDGAAAILLSASDAGKLTGAINDAVDRGVPVMMFDSDAPASKRFAFYGADDIKVGTNTMAELVTLMNGKGKVAILAGNQNAPNLQNRVKGAKEEAAKHPGISVVGVFNHNEAPQDAAAEVLRVNNAYPEITGWAMIGGWPLFTQTLLTDLNPAKQKVVAVDALPAQLAYVDKGIAPVLLAQPVYLWGAVGVRTLFEKVHDKKDPATPVMSMDLIRVTKANLGEYSRQLKAWGFENIPEEYLKLAK
ncbi:MAG: substrate-binding domain-containing protein [bacterium]